VQSVMERPVANAPGATTSPSGDPVSHGAEISIAIVDDHPVLAEGLAGVLAGFGIEARAIRAISMESVIAELEMAPPTVALVDYHLGDLGTAEPIMRAMWHRGVKTVVLTGDFSDLTRARCLEAGAAGVLSKGTSTGEILVALSAAAAGDRLVGDDERHALITMLRAERSRRSQELRRFETLTARERDVLAAICGGRSAAEIAECSYVSLATVRSQIRAILLKLGVTSQLAAIVAVHRAGWVPEPTPDSSILAMAATP
jgi:DNA-binding NarL/FixJ family response regulator